MSARDHASRVAAFFARRVAEHGASFEALDWKDRDSQELRFEILADIGLQRGDVVWDVGCGLGDFSHWHRRTSETPISYVGLDPAGELVEAARLRDPASLYVVADALDLSELDLPRPDIVVVSGLFNLNGPDVEAFSRSVVTAAFERARRGVAYNRMSDQVDFRVDHLAYSSAADSVAFALSLTRNVVLRHDYPLFEYTVYLTH